MSSAENLPGLVVLATDGDLSALDEMSAALAADPRVERVLRARDVAEALTHLQAEPVDVVFTETRLVGLTGMELARVLDAMTVPPPLVFVAARDDQAVDAYEVGALDYVLKPVCTDRLSRSIDRLLAERRLRYADCTPIEAGPGQVLLSHAAGDEEAVRDLHRRLVQDGVPCWWEGTDLRSERDRGRELGAAVQRSRYVLACLSHRSITDRGYLQPQLKDAVDAADEQPEGATFLIPVRLEPCPLPQRLARRLWIDLFGDRGYDRLLAALRVTPPV